MSALEVVKAPGANLPFSLEPIMVNLEVGFYMGPILPGPLAYLLAVRQAEDVNGSRGGGGGGGSIGGDTKNSKVRATGGGGVRVWDQYNVQLLIISLHYGENSWSFLAGTVLTTLHGHAIFKNCHLCGVCWEDCECRKSHVPTPPGVAITIYGLIKVDRRG